MVPLLLCLAPQCKSDRPAAQHLTPALTHEGVLQFHVAQLLLALGNQVADDEVALPALNDQFRQVPRPRWRHTLLRICDSRRNLALTLLFGFARGHWPVLREGRRGARHGQRRVVRRLQTAARGSACGTEEEGHERQRRGGTPKKAHTGIRKSKSGWQE